MAPSKKARILIVEDNPDIQVLLSYLLQAQFDLKVATCFDEAVEVAASHSFDVFLLDINLCESRTGIDLLKTLRQTSVYSLTPALALTAHAVPGGGSYFLKFGFLGHIGKPFTREELLQTIRTALATTRN